MSEVELLLVNEADNCTYIRFSFSKKRIVNLNDSTTNSKTMQSIVLI